MSDIYIDALREPRVVALTIWGEARGEGLAGMAAVASVIRNRAVHPRVRWWGTGFRDVCLKPEQFSVWNENDPNRRLLISIGQGSPLPSAMVPTWIAAQMLATEVMDGRFPDITGGADHYHSLDVAPPWSKGRTPIKRMGQHVFYKLH